jgi:hypothetical protein
MFLWGKLRGSSNPQASLRGRYIEISRGRLVVQMSMIPQDMRTVQGLRSRREMLRALTILQERLTVL